MSVSTASIYEHVSGLGVTNGISQAWLRSPQEACEVNAVAPISQMRRREAIFNRCHIKAGIQASASRSVYVSASQRG